ncbi:hypothetical protein DP113_29865 [Brasilonema octagenarum UFV-E1]|uniref:Uncharacterized protein n=2 Tax=Brasilonema TaxID=383614 RepID=A0A856MN58_9CYAN|nr:MULTISPECIES: hypothetical protein [Brasilonema]NMF61387.1 hypothetical protein [Brasilonema octagenarum UFV-OR1]QDL11520.1 hypothetical protein DP114_29705 [Brasilonema sennae CENA114]QDL17902.1 hypothetical protein DP113_29865 [Brasilonema octagenarum UFV-E1]
MANLNNIPVDRLDSEHYRQMLVRDGERRFSEWHGEFLRHQREFLKDQHNRIRELENLRKSIYVDHKRRSQESRNEFLRYYYKFLAEMRRY